MHEMAALEKDLILLNQLSSSSSAEPTIAVNRFVTVKAHPYTIGDHAHARIEFQARPALRVQTAATTWG